MNAIHTSCRPQQPEILAATILDTPQKYRVKFVADEPVIQQIILSASEDSENLNIESVGKEEDATRLGFDLTAVSAVMTAVSSTLYVGGLAVRILKWLQRTRTNKVVIQTPFQTIELSKDAGTHGRRCPQAFEGRHGDLGAGTARLWRI